jgi:transposase
VAKKQKRYSSEFRAQAVRLCEESDKTIAEVARELGVEYQTLYEWMRKAGKTKRVDEPVQASPASDEEVRRLRRELDEVKMERDFLKKAAAFFARMNK